MAMYAAAYAGLKKRGVGRWPDYGLMLALLRDESLTLAQIGKQCGVSKERMRQVCDQFFPRERPEDTRRNFGAHAMRKREQARRRRACVEADFKTQNRVYVLLARHAEASRQELSLLWGRHAPMARYVLLNGKKHYVMHIRCVAQMPGPCAHSSAPCEKLRGCSGMLVLVDINDGKHQYSRLYRIGTKTFRRARQTNVLIRLAEGGRRQKIDWQRFLVSKLE